jgi:hypothetical protein
MQTNIAELNHRLYTLSSLAARFPQGLAGSLTPKSRARLLDLVRAMVQEIARNIEKDGQWQREILPVLKPEWEPPSPGGLPCATWNIWSSAVQKAAIENERLYWRMFGEVRASQPDGRSLSDVVGKISSNDEIIASIGVCAGR